VTHAEAVAVLQRAATIHMRVTRLPETLIQEMELAHPSMQIHEVISQLDIFITRMTSNSHACPDIQDVHVIEFAIAGGLGFSISGGIDVPLAEEDLCIYVTGIQDGGAAARDGRLQIGDRVCAMIFQLLAATRLFLDFKIFLAFLAFGFLVLMVACRSERKERVECETR
jgi:hypothetical protein